MGAMTDVVAYHFADVRVWSSAEIPELLRADAARGSGDITISWVDQLAPTPTVWFHQWDDGPEIWAKFGEGADGWVVEFPELAEFRISPSATEVRVQTRRATPAFTVRHLLLNQILPLMLSRQGRMVLHAGAVAINGAVTAFVGPTGSGKSTLVAACARAGAEVVSDDCVVVSREGTRWMAVPSYPALRLWSSALEHLGWSPDDRTAASHYTDKHRVGPAASDWQFAGGPYPLVRLIRLATVEPVRPLAVDLYSQVFRLDVRDQAEALQMFHAVADLAAQVEVRDLAAPAAQRDAPAVAAVLCGGDPVAVRALFGA
jgi:hypothetical protein